MTKVNTKGKIRIGDGDESDIIICMRVTKPLKYPDNLVASCTRCHHLVQHRPHAPKNPQKVCMECIARVEGGLNAIEAMITPETAKEIEAYIRRMRAN